MEMKLLNDVESLLWDLVSLMETLDMTATDTRTTDDEYWDDRLATTLAMIKRIESVRESKEIQANVQASLDRLSAKWSCK